MKISGEISFESTQIKAEAAAKRLGVSSDLHPDDQLLRHLTKKNGADAGSKYIEGGRVDAGKVKLLVESLRISKQRLRILDFASGFGRVTRHFKDMMPGHEIFASDIHPNACEFMKSVLNIPSFISQADPDDLDIGSHYDVIFVMSLFSHLPDKTFGRWLGTLYQRLAPGGYLFFTANGKNTINTYPAFFGELLPDGARFGYANVSDQLDLDAEDYGSMVVTIRYVLDQIDEYAPDAMLYRFMAGGWLGTQDGWVLKKPS